MQVLRGTTEADKLTYFMCNCHANGTPKSTGMYPRKNYEDIPTSIIGMVFRLLKAEARPMSVAEITDCLELNPRTVRNSIYRLIQSFKVTKHGEGPRRYALK